MLQDQCLLTSSSPRNLIPKIVKVFWFFSLANVQQYFIAPLVWKWSLPCNCFMDTIFLFLMLDSNIEPIIWETFSALDVYLCLFLISWMSHWQALGEKHSGSDTFVPGFSPFGKGFVNPFQADAFSTFSSLTWWAAVETFQFTSPEWL